VAFLAAFSLRASAIVFNIRMGPPGEFIRLGKTDEDSNQQQDDSNQQQSEEEAK
jgi:hypothetical protein